VSVLAADLEVKVGADIADALKKLSSIERYAQLTTNALNKPSKLAVDTADAEKKLHSFTQKLKDGFKASLAGLSEAGRGLLAGDGVGFLSGIVDSITGLTSQIPLLGSAATLAGNGVKSLIMPMEKLISMGMQWQGTWEKNKKLLVSMGDSAEGAEKQLNGLYQMAIKRGFQMDDLAVVYQRLRSIGFGAEDAMDKLKGFTNASAAIRGGAAAVETMAAAFEQMKDSETTASRVIKQFERMGLPIMQTLSDATGFSPAKIRDMMKKEQIDSKGLMDILTKEFQSGRFENLAENMAKGLSGQQNAFSQISAKLAGEATASLRSVMGARLRDINEIIGSDSAEGLIQGFKKGLDIPVSGADYLVSGLLQALKDYLGIHSPSALLRDTIGVPMGMGILEGVVLALDQQGDKVHQAVTKIITREGDTLRKIAERMAIPLEQLTQRDPTRDPDQELDPGQTISIPNYIDPMRGRAARRSRRSSENTLGDRAANEALLDNQQVQNFLALIRQFEAGGRYTTKFGGGDFTGGLNQSDFPFAQARTRTWSPTLGRFVTTAAIGGYQYEPRTWHSVANANGLTDISARNQDIGAVSLLRMRGALPDVMSGNLMGALTKVADEWEIFKVALTQKPQLLSQMQQFYGQRGGFAASLSDPSNSLSLEKQLFEAEKQRELLQQMIDSYARSGDGKSLHTLQVDPATGLQSGMKGAINLDVPEWQNTGEQVNNIQQALLNRANIQELERLNTVISQLEAKQPAGSQIFTPKTPEKPEYDFSNFDPSDYPVIGSALGGLGSMLTLVKESLPDVLKLAGEISSHQLPQLKDGWTAANNAAVTGLKRTNEEMQHNRQEFTRTGQTLTSIRNAFESSFASAFSTTEGGFKGMVGRMVTSFTQALQGMIAQAIAARLAKLIFGDPDAKDEGGGGGGNWFSKFIQWGISALGAGLGGHGGGGGAHTGATANGLHIAPGIDLFGHHAAGGWMAPGEVSWAGENGPELVQAGPGGMQVFSNRDSRRIMNGGGGNTYHIHVNVPASRTGYMQPRDRRALAEDIVGLLPH
jgi:muramidase (phage lysozyme)